MFYSHGQQQPPFNVADVKYDTANKGDSKFKKKSLINQVNFINRNPIRSWSLIYIKLPSMISRGGHRIVPASKESPPRRV